MKALVMFHQTTNVSSSLEGRQEIGVFKLND